MRILMINTVCGYGSTGTICTDIASVLEKQGHECYIAYGQGTTTYTNSYKIGTKVENHLHNIGSRLLGKQGYFTQKGTHQFITFLKEYNPDVIHLHNLHGNYLNLKILFDYLKEVQKPIVWTLHDCWAFTGKCAHYTDVACYKWQTHCNTCPQLDTYPPSVFFDQTENMFSDKQKWINGIKDLTIVPVSEWLASDVKKSFFKKHPIIPIYNWVDHNIFRPLQEDVKEQYSIPSNKFIILCVSASWGASDNKFKDVIKLNELIDPNTMQIVIVGKVRQQELPNSIVHIPYVNGKEELAKVYNSADVYVHLSTEDTFGKVIAEALSCGIPAIVYNSTACPELIGEGCGYSVEKRKVKDVYKKILIIKDSGKSKYNKKSRAYVIRNFDIDNNIKETIEIYQKKYIKQ